MRAGTVRVLPDGFGVWEEHVNADLDDEVFRPLGMFLRSRGWKVGTDPDIAKNYRTISRFHRLARKGPLFATIEVHGLHIEFKAWSEDFTSDHPNGPRYDRDKRDRMPYPTRLRLDLEIQRAVAWLCATYGYTADHDHDPRVKRTALERIHRDYATCCHTDKALGHPRIERHNAKSASGDLITQGATVWTRRRADGRVVRGRALYRLNNMWVVITGEHSAEYVSAHEVHLSPPTSLRREADPRARRERLERMLREATNADDFDRAKLMRRILFGDAPTYRVFSKEKGYYATNACGYSASPGAAGRFTAEEAIAHCARTHGQLTPVPIGDAPPLEVAL